MRVLLMELNRISSHLVCIATGGMEIGALTVMTIGFRERELVLDLFELITGLRMNHAFIRPGGVAQDLPPGALDEIRDFVALMKKRLPGVRRALQRQPDLQGPPRGRRPPRPRRLPGARASPARSLRATGYPWDLRKTQPYCGYEDYDFDVQTWDTCDSYGRFRIRLDEMWESLQDRRAGRRPAGRPRGRAGDGRRQEDRLAQPARDRQRRHGQQPRPHPPHHGRVDGGPDPPLQAGHRGLPGARPARPTSPVESPARRARRARRLRRRHPPVPGALPRPVVHQPAGHERDERGRHGRRRHRRRSPPSTP